MWVISDGTLVALGGAVEGDSAFARRIRARLLRHRSGEWPIEIALDPPPSGLTRLDVSDAYALHVWLVELTGPAGLEIISSPPEAQAPASGSPAPHEPNRTY